MNNTLYRNWIGHGNVNCNNITNSHKNNVTVNKPIADESPEIMQWLSPLDSRGRHHNLSIRTARLDDVGNWFLETMEFRECKSNEGGADKAILFCCGNPGVGKTYPR